MAEKKKTALAVVMNEDFVIANRYNGLSEEDLKELEDEMGDLDANSGIDCRKIKIPSGGGIAYEIQGEDDDSADIAKEIKGVVIFTHRVNAYWANAYGTEDQNKIPDCSSMDGITGIVTETGECCSCENCPCNQYGSAIDQKGQQSKGKACKNTRRLYIMLDNDPNIYLLTVPPTSIKDVNKQLVKILSSGTPYTSMVLKFTLEKTKNSAGIDFSKVVIKKDSLLPPDVSEIAKEMRRQIKEQYMNVAITAADYNAPSDTESATTYQTPAAEAVPPAPPEPPVDDDNGGYPFG